MNQAFHKKTELAWALSTHSRARRRSRLLCGREALPEALRFHERVSWEVRVPRELTSDLCVVGGGMAGVSAALAARAAAPRWCLLQGP
jgi:NADPH-dependent 2,4-dienoyl-CoA reductase/sulfur reductase-like enzyme